MTEGKQSLYNIVTFRSEILTNYGEHDVFLASDITVFNIVIIIVMGGGALFATKHGLAK